MCGRICLFNFYLPSTQRLHNASLISFEGIFFSPLFSALVVVVPIPPPLRCASWISSLPSPGAVKWQLCDLSYSLDTWISEMVAGVTYRSNGQNGSMFLSRIFHHEVIAESCSRLFSPRNSLGYFNLFPSPIPLPRVVTPFSSSPCIMSINSLLFKAALSCNQEPY